MTDEEAMRLALAQAALAGVRAEVPVGAVVLCRGEVIAVGANQPIEQHDPTAHAEVVALRAAAARLGNYRLDGCELFVTLEPCAMCAGAMLHARLARVVYGAADPKTGAAGSVTDLFAMSGLNHQTQVQGGVLSQACGQLLREFFQRRREEQVLTRTPLREDALRTPAARFEGLDPPIGVLRCTSQLPSLAGLNLFYTDAQQDPGAPGLTFLCVHGGHGWSHVFERMLPVWHAAGHRVIAVDLPGFGRSDKPKKEHVHTAAWHRAVLHELVASLGLCNLVMVLAGTGGLIALGLPTRDTSSYRAVVALDARMAGAIAQRCDGEAWPADWAAAEPAQLVDVLRNDPQPPAFAAGDAPFPDNGYRAGPRAFYRLATEFFEAPQWPAARLPSSAADDGGAQLAHRLLDGLAMGYSRS